MTIYQQGSPHQLNILPSRVLDMANGQAVNSSGWKEVDRHGTALYALQSVQEISIAAFLPITVILFTVAVLMILVRIRSRRKDRDQLERLEEVYNVLESAPAVDKRVWVDADENLLRQLHRAVVICESDLLTTPFFQPLQRHRSPGSSSETIRRQLVAIEIGEPDEEEPGKGPGST